MVYPSPHPPESSLFRLKSTQLYFSLSFTLLSISTSFHRRSSKVLLFETMGENNSPKLKMHRTVELAAQVLDVAFLTVLLSSKSLPLMQRTLRISSYRFHRIMSCKLMFLLRLQLLQSGSLWERAMFEHRMTKRLMLQIRGRNY